ncbi:MAG TPA: TRAP transporter TatT component family protein [Vicinamibacterales bacterium]|nr:TRAP transporter TatT component family protein [Vicinamibacterales bacterium]
MHAFLALLLVAGTGLAADSDPDALYRQRTDLARAREAIGIWETRLKANPRDYESAWKIARATYWIGPHEEKEAGRRTLERGVAAGKQATVIAPDRAEGYFWTAANMGALAESYGLRQGLKYRGAIKDALEGVVKIDRSFQRGSAYSALGRWYHMVPGLFGGSEARSEEYLRKALSYNADSVLAHYYLAQTLFERDKASDGANELKKAIAAPSDPDFEPEEREMKAKAEAELAKRSRAR